MADRTARSKAKPRPRVISQTTHKDVTLTGKTAVTYPTKMTLEPRRTRELDPAILPRSARRKTKTR